MEQSCHLIVDGGERGCRTDLAEGMAHLSKGRQMTAAQSCGQVPGAFCRTKPRTCWWTLAVREFFQVWLAQETLELTDGYKEVRVTAVSVVSRVKNLS